MANHEGYSLGIQVDFSQLERANKAVSALSQGLGTISQKMAGMHPSDSLPKGIDQAKAATQSYIKLLDSEGKTYQANKERVKTYQSAIGELSSKQKSLEEQLNRTAQATGKSSSAFQAQLVKVNQNATEINKYKGAIEQANAEMRKTNPSIFDRVKNKLDDTTKSADKTHSAFKTILGASLVSNAVMSGFNFVKSSLGEMIHSAHKYNLDQQTMNATWLTLTGNAKKGKGMVKQIDDMAAAAQNSTAMVDNLSQKFYAIDKDPKETGQLVKSVLTLQDAFGKSDDEVENFGTQFGQMMANGKVSAQDMMSFVNVFPVLRTNLLKTMQVQTKNHSMTMKQMNELMSKGQISSKTMIGVVESTAHKYRNATDNFNKTIPGMVRTVKSQMPRLMSAFDKPFTKMENPLIKQISKWSTSKDTEKAFSRLGSSVSKGVNKAAVPFVGGEGKKVSATKVLNKGIDNISAGTTAFFNWIAQHGKDIKTLGSSVMSIAGTLGKGVWKDASSIFVNIGKATGLIGQNAEKHGGALHAIAEGFNNLAKNKTALKIVSDAIVAMVTVKGAKKVARPFIDIAAHGYQAVKYVRSFASGIKGISDAKGLDSVSTKFLQSGFKFRDAGQKVGHLFKGGFKDGTKNLFGSVEVPNKFTGLLQSAHSAGGFRNLSTAGKAGTVAAGAGVAIDAGASFYSAYQNRHSADKRSQDIGKGIGAGIGGGIGLWFGGPLGAAVGAQVGKVIGGWGGKAVNSFTKGWQKKKPPKKFWSLENLGWSAHDMAKKTGRAAGQAVNSVKKGWSSHKPPKKFWSLENLGFAGKVAWNHTVYGAAINSISAMRKGWTADKPPKKFWSLENLGWSAHSMFNGFISAVKGTIKWFHEQWDGMTSWIGKATSRVGDIASDIGNNIGSIFGGSKSGKKVSAHATGGHINSGSMALVGEAGAELAYKVNGKHARLLGANGPEITKVHTNEHILNARDTHRVLNGGLGNGVVLKGYANGNSKVNSTWKKTADQTGKETKKTRVAAVNEYTAMRRGVDKQMTGLHDGTVKLAKSTSKGFGKALGKMKGFANDAMKDTIDQINRGITGIDKVLSQFGGNASVIKPVKFATGSNGQLANNTLAMVNDTQSGPRQEAIVKSSGDIWLPHGDNRILPLQKGDAVLNGSQTQQLANSWGLPHFAKGSGVSPSALKKIASRGAANPVKSFADMFTSKLKSGKVDITAGTVDLAKNSGKQLGVPWTNAMWTVINNAIGDGAGRGGTREAFLKYAEANFSGVKYVMGAASKAASDCSGMIMQALRHFNVNIGRSTVDMQNSGGTEYLGKSLSKTVPGDLVIFGHGTGAAGHVGIIKNPKTGTMFNETPPSARVSRIADDTSMGYGFYRVKGLHDATSKSSNAKPSTRLMNLAKRQLGAGAIKWIKDKLGDEGSLGSNIGGEGVQRWAGTVKRVLGMLGLSTSKSMIDKVLRQIQTESGGNPAARQPGADPDGDGSGPALGLMQTKRATFDAYKRKGAGNIFNGPDNIYAGLNYAKHKYGPELSALGNGHGYAKGGNPPVGDSVLVGENGPEIAKFKDPVHVYSHEQSKRLKLDDLINKNRVKMPKVKGGAPNVTININGNISSEKDAKKYGDIIYRKISEIFEQIGLDYGADPSMY